MAGIDNRENYQKRALVMHLINNLYLYNLARSFTVYVTKECTQHLQGSILLMKEKKGPP